MTGPLTGRGEQTWLYQIFLLKRGAGGGGRRSARNGMEDLWEDGGAEMLFRDAEKMLLFKERVLALEDVE